MEQTVFDAKAADAGVATEAADVNALLASRAYLYALFHKLFGGVPDAATLTALADETTQEALAAFAVESPALAQAGDFLRALGERDLVALVDEAKDEYTRLFVGPAELVAYPWESPYVTHQASACQESTLAVRAAYRAQGLAPRKLLRVPDDHVALMCAFLAELTERSLAALSAGRRAVDEADAGAAASSVETEAAELARGLRVQEAFARDHMAGWLPEYARLVRRSKTAVLYPQLIEAFAEFVRLDLTFLSEAAFWAESLEGAPAFAEDPSVARLRTAAVQVAALRPFGIEDNELVPTAA